LTLGFLTLEFPLFALHAVRCFRLAYSLSFFSLFLFFISFRYLILYFSICDLESGILLQDFSPSFFAFGAPSRAAAASMSELTSPPIRIAAPVK
jgi:hypothetical protein